MGGLAAIRGLSPGAVGCDEVWALALAGGVGAGAWFTRRVREDRVRVPRAGVGAGGWFFGLPPGKGEEMRAGGEGGVLQGIGERAPGRAAEQSTGGVRRRAWRVGLRCERYGRGLQCWVGGAPPLLVVRKER